MLSKHEEINILSSSLTFLLKVSEFSMDRVRFFFLSCISVYKIFQKWFLFSGEGEVIVEGKWSFSWIFPIIRLVPWLHKRSLHLPQTLFTCLLTWQLLIGDHYNLGPYCTWKTINVYYMHLYSFFHYQSQPDFIKPLIIYFLKTITLNILFFPLPASFDQFIS